MSGEIDHLNWIFTRLIRAVTARTPKRPKLAPRREDPKWLRAIDAAKIAGTARAMITHAVNAGKLNSNGLKGPGRRIDADDLPRWIRERAERAQVKYEQQLRNGSFEPLVVPTPVPEPDRQGLAGPRRLVHDQKTARATAQGRDRGRAPCADPGSSMKVAARDFIHPEDHAALENLKAIPLFAACLKSFMNIGTERSIQGLSMANKIRLGKHQLPAIHEPLPRICETLGIDEPELYLAMDPAPNAYTQGDTRLMITVTSGLIELLDEDETCAVLAHECGHIACRHVLYHTMAQMLAKYGPAIFGPLAALSMPVQLGLFYWARRSELSADRAAALFMQGSSSVVETMIRLAGGPKSITANVSLDLYLEAGRCLRQAPGIALGQVPARHRRDEHGPPVSLGAGARDHALVPGRAFCAHGRWTDAKDGSVVRELRSGCWGQLEILQELRGAIGPDMVAVENPKEANS